MPDSATAAVPLTADRAADLLPQLTHFVRTLPPPAGQAPDKVRFCIGFSGGRDSVALLHLFSRLVLAGEIGADCVTALHVHHGLSPNAEGWAAFCHTYCQQLGIPLQIERVQLTRQQCAGQGLEAAARAARHAAFANPEKNGAADFIVLAHHADDQAETLLFNLLRGAGVQGAAAMPVSRTLGAGLQLLRPLLGIPRAALEGYLARFAQPWIDDESNQDTRFTRNYLRHAVLPVLQQRFPQAVAQLSQASQHFAEAQGLLEEIATSDARAAGLHCDEIQHIQPAEQPAAPLSARLTLAALLALSPARQANLLRHVLRRAGWKMPESRQLEELLRQLRQIGESTDQQFVFQLQAGSLHCWQGQLHWVAKPEGEIPAQPMFWTGEAAVRWGRCTLRLQATMGSGLSQQRWLEAGGAWLMARQGGESLQIAANRPRRPLKKLLQESGLPPWQRASLPLLLVDNALIACAGIGIDPRWQAGANEAGWALVLS